MLKPEATNCDFIKTTVKELKGECRRRGLNVGGQMDELFNRLVLSLGFAAKHEMQRLSLLHKKFGASGLVVQLSDDGRCGETAG